MAENCCTLFVDYKNNVWNTQLNEPTNQIEIKVVKPTNKKNFFL